MGIWLGKEKKQLIKSPAEGASGNHHTLDHTWSTTSAITLLHFITLFIMCIILAILLCLAFISYFKWKERACEYIFSILVWPWINYIEFVSLIFIKWWKKKKKKKENYWKGKWFSNVRVHSCLCRVIHNEENAIFCVFLRIYFLISRKTFELFFFRNVVLSAKMF